MALIKEWKESMKPLGNHDLQQIDKAIDTLLDWPLFRKTYPEMATIRLLVKEVRIDRSRV